MWAQRMVWGVCLDRVDWSEENTRSCHLVLWSRNYEYSALTWKDQFYYQSMSLEFRYGLEKVLGTQNYPTHWSASTHCVLHLNSIKSTFDIASSHTYTHTSIHLSIQHGISSQDLTFIYYAHQPTLAYVYHDISCYLIQGSKQIMAERQAWQQSINHHIYSKLLDMKSSIKQTYKNASPYQCITYLTYFAASQHL